VPQYKINTPLMASDFGDLLDLTFSGQTNKIVAQTIDRFTVNENGEHVPASSLTVREYMALVNEAMQALGFTETAGND